MYRSSVTVTVPAALSIAVLLSVLPAPAQEGCVNNPVPNHDCPGCVPLGDLGTGFYVVGAQSFQGGLYPDGLNVPPPAHRDAALSMAAAIVPRDPAGVEDQEDGLIGLATISMSNGSQEFASFERRADLAPGRNARVVIVNTAQGGQAADIIQDPDAPYWDLVVDRVTAAGLTVEQVQAVWIKQAASAPCCGFVFPDHALALRADLRRVVQNVHRTLPNVKIAYLSSRIYGGYAGVGNEGRGEPLSYEQGFAFKWLIEDQIDGDPRLNFDPDDALPDRSPLLLWGPYLWAEGPAPREDGLIWCRDDLEGDGVHPGLGAETKVANLLRGFLSRHETAESWYSARSDVELVVLDTTDDAYVRASAPDATFGLEDRLRISTDATTYLRFDTTGAVLPLGTLLHAKLSLRVDGVTSAQARVHPVASSAWDEATVTFTTAPPFDPGNVIADVPAYSRDNAFSAGVTSDLLSQLGGPVTYALTFPAGNDRALRARQSFTPREPPRLVLTVKVE